MTVKFMSRELKVIEKAEAVLADTDTDVTLQHIERNCFANCYANASGMEKIARENLQLVAGSLGLCNPGPTWFEWGSCDNRNPNTKVYQFTKCPVTGKRNVHFWYRTQGGHIYDILDPYLDVVAMTWGKRLEKKGLLAGKIIPGKLPEEIERDHGLKYVEADPLVTSVLIAKYKTEISVVPLS